MAKRILATIVCVLVVGTVFASTSVIAGGSEQGTFPDRVFMVNNEKPGAVEGISYITTIMPESSANWWVEAMKLRSYVLVQVFEGDSTRTKPFSSSELREVGGTSKETPLSAGVLYTVAFTCFGKKSSAQLLEHYGFTYPLPCKAHKPISILSDSDFTAENGVVSGDGSPSSPYVISGWAIDGRHDVDCIRIWHTSKYFVIRQCNLYSGGGWGGGMFLSFLSNGIVENCYFTDNPMGVYVETASSVIVRNNNFIKDIGGACQFMQSTDCEFDDNTIVTDNWGLAISNSMRVVAQRNTFNYGGIELAGFTREEFSTLTITPDNTINGKPIVFIKDSADVEVVGSDCSQLLIACSTNVHVSGLALTGDLPLHLAFVEGGIVEKCEFTGVSFEALRLDYCANVILSDNWLHDSTGGWEGLVVIGYSPDITLKDNVFETIVNEAIRIQWDSDNCKVIGNSFSYVGLTAGLFMTSGIVLEKNKIQYSSYGVMIIDSYHSSIRENTFDSNYLGVYLSGDSTDNRAWKNNFLSNGIQARDSSTGINYWDDGAGCGNYWTDYQGVDVVEPFGIGDTPYVNGAVTDHYPLMQAWSGI